MKDEKELLLSELITSLTETVNERREEITDFYDARLMPGRSELLCMIHSEFYLLISRILIKLFTGGERL